MNKVFLYGNVGKDPDTRTVNDKTVTKFSLATNKTYTNASGEKVTDTQWHNITIWGKLAETAAKYVKKGNPLIVEGEINYRSYENKEGVTVYVTEILGSHIHFVCKAEAKSEPPQASGEWKGKKEVKAMSKVEDLPGNVANYDEIPDLPF